MCCGLYADSWYRRKVQSLIFCSVEYTVWRECEYRPTTYWIFRLISRVWGFAVLLYFKQTVCINWRAYYDIAEWTGMKINEVATAAERSWSLERDTTRRQPFLWRKAQNRHAYNVRLFYMYASFVWDEFRFTVGYTEQETDVPRLMSFTENFISYSARRLLLGLRCCLKTKQAKQRQYTRGILTIRYDSRV